jgi:hypothetical protein
VNECSFAIGDWIAATAAIIAAIGVWTNYIFPKITEARRRDGLEKYVKILIGKSVGTLNDLKNECQNIANQISSKDKKDVFANEIILRTEHFKEVSMERLFDLLITSRGLSESEYVESFFNFSDSIIRVNHIGKAAYKNFSKFSDEFAENQSAIHGVIADLVNYIDAVQKPLMQGQGQSQQVIVLEDSFEHKLISIHMTWSKIDVNSEDKKVSPKQLDPYVVVEELITPLRSLCQSLPKHPASFAGIQIIRKFDVAFTNFDTMKRHYAAQYSNYADSLDKLVLKIQSESGKLLRFPRVDREYFRNIFGPNSLS